jgi:hypothetical protein
MEENNSPTTVEEVLLSRGELPSNKPTHSSRLESERIKRDYAILKIQQQYNIADNDVVFALLKSYGSYADQLAKITEVIEQLHEKVVKNLKNSYAIDKKVSDDAKNLAENALKDRNFFTYEFKTQVENMFTSLKEAHNPLIKTAQQIQHERLENTNAAQKMLEQIQESWDKFQVIQLMGIGCIGIVSVLQIAYLFFIR